jgi:UDP-glucose 4-epimerase
MRALVTGGAGYIGSHMVQRLVKDGHHVLVVDDLSTGHRDAVAPHAAFVQADVADAGPIADLLAIHRIDTILHFAARSVVGESMTDPRRYYKGNLAATMSLLDTAIEAGVKVFVQSSTAAVYGDPVSIPIDESHPTCPINPYGDTKLAIERMLASYGRAYGLAWTALRYFNAAGSDVQAGLGERHPKETHLIPRLIDAALGHEPPVTLFGTDYDTADGTCVRDYIHVLDLCDAHLRAAQQLACGATLGPINLGTGSGHTVAEVVAVVERVSGRAVPVLTGPRRPGDPTRLVACADRAAKVLGWSAQRSDLTRIVRDAWQVRSAS